MATEIKVPVLGESVTEATVTKWFKAVGDAVATDEALLELETDKVTLEVNAPATGTLSEIAAAEGADVEVGALLGAITEGKGAPAAKKAPPAAEPAAAPEPAPAPAQVAEAKPLSPAVCKLVEENNLDPAGIAASGKDGRLTKGDVLAFLKGGETAPAAPLPPAQPAAAMPEAQYPPRPIGPREERVRMTRLRQRIAERLKEAQNTAAMLTTFNEADMSASWTCVPSTATPLRRSMGCGLALCRFSSRPASWRCVRCRRSTLKSMAPISFTRTTTTSAWPWALNKAWWCRCCVTPMP